MQNHEAEIIERIATQKAALMRDRLNDGYTPASMGFGPNISPDALVESEYRCWIEWCEDEIRKIGAEEMERIAWDTSGDLRRTILRVVR
jgi:hypothetical protein